MASIFAACGGGEEETALPTPVEQTASEGNAPQADAPQASARQADSSGAGVPDALMQIAQARGLSPDDIRAALMTYTPSGKWDEYHAHLVGRSFGQHDRGRRALHAHPQRTSPSSRPNPGRVMAMVPTESEEVLDGGNVDGVKIRMGDTHHPALSETAGDYDGQFLFINDKASARLAVIDLRDFETKQIVKDPNMISNHGATFVTPNTEYVIAGSQYATPLGWDYAPLERVQREVSWLDHPLEV